MADEVKRVNEQPNAGGKLRLQPRMLWPTASEFLLLLATSMHIITSLCILIETDCAGQDAADQAREAVGKGPMAADAEGNGTGKGRAQIHPGRDANMWGHEPHARWNAARQVLGNHCNPAADRCPGREQRSAAGNCAAQRAPVLSDGEQSSTAALDQMNTNRTSHAGIDCNLVPMPCIHRLYHLQCISAALEISSL